MLINQTFEFLSKILKENQILQNDEEESTEKIQIIFYAFLKLQKNFIAQTNKSKLDIQDKISNVMPDIVQSCGAVVSEEIKDLFLSISNILQVIFGQ